MELVSCALFLLVFTLIYYTDSSYKKKRADKMAQFKNGKLNELKQGIGDDQDAEDSEDQDSDVGGSEIKKYQPIPDIPILESVKKLISSGWKFSAIFKFAASLEQPVNWIPGAIGLKGILLINDFQLVKEAFFNPKFNGKLHTEVWTAHSGGQYGVMSTQGKVWEEQRKFCTRQLKLFGFGTKSMEPLIHTEIGAFLDLLEKSKLSGQPISPNKLFYAPVLNPLWWILTGERFANEDDKLYKIVITTFNAMNRSLRFPAIVLLFLSTLSKSTILFICRLFPFIFPKEIQSVLGFNDLRNYFRQLINERRRILNPSDTPQDFLEAYMLEIMKCTNPQSGFFQHTGEKNLLGAMADFFIAGGDTTANELTWSLLHLIRNPDIQQEIQKEIDISVGQDRKPTLHDRPNCPYTEAFLEEVLRTNPVALTSLPHEALEDVTLGPYFIPKGTTLLVNVMGINYDTRIWGDPDNFRPARFLSKSSESSRPVFIRHEAMASFSIGKRRCLGEQLARDNMFLFISSICQRFTLERDVASLDSTFPPLLEEPNTAVHTPAKFYIVVRDRVMQ